MRRPRLSARAVSEIEAIYRQRLESLLAVDEAVERIVARWSGPASSTAR